MVFLKVISVNISLFNEINPTGALLLKKGQDTIIDELDKVLDDKNFLRLVRHFRKQVVDMYPEVPPVTWKILDVCIKRNHCKDTLMLAFRVAKNKGIDQKKIYQAIATSWGMMNDERVEQGDNALPFCEEPPTGVVKNGILNAIEVNGTISPKAEDIKAEGAFKILDRFIRTNEELSVSTTMAVINHVFFELLQVQGLLHPDDLESTEEDKDIGYDFFNNDFKNGLDALEDVVDNNEDYLNVLHCAIASGFKFYNLMLEFNEGYDEE